MKRNITLIILVLASSLPTKAQYTFTLNASWSGKCSGYTAQMNQAIRGFKSQAINGFPTRELCEQTRALCHQELGHIEIVYYDVKTGKEIKRETTNCKLNVSTTPCTGHPMAGSVGTLNTLGVSQGTSFYSVNTANEIQNWTEDDMERMLALNKDFQSLEPTNVATGDPSFDDALNKLSGRMPDGSISFIKKDNQIVSVSPPSQTTDIVMSHDLFSSPFTPINLREGGSSMIYSEDFDMSNAFSEMKRREEERKQWDLEKERKDAEIWDEIKSKLDDENFKLLAYFFQQYNGDERPKFLGITESGCYIFESKDGNKVFSVSSDANDLQAASFEEHSWDDENIIKAIKEDGLKEILNDRFELEYPNFNEIKGGTISYDDLKKLSPNDLRKLLPKLKAEIKLKLFDNSSTVTYEYMHLYGSHISVGGKATLSTGGKDNTSASISVVPEGTEKESVSLGGKDIISASTSINTDGSVNKTKLESDGISYIDYSKSLGPIRLKAGTSIDLTTGALEGKGGYVFKKGNNYIYCSGGAKIEGGTRIGKNLAKGPWGIFYGERKVGGFQCKNITHSTDNIPTLKK